MRRCSPGRRCIPVGVVSYDVRMTRQKHRRRPQKRKPWVVLVNDVGDVYCIFSDMTLAACWCHYCKRFRALSESDRLIPKNMPDVFLSPVCPECDISVGHVCGFEGCWSPTQCYDSRHILQWEHGTG